MSDYEKVCLIRGDQGRAIRALLDRVADKWSLLVIATLHGTRLRFTDLQRSVLGISQRMHTRPLGHLAEDGLVTRTSYPEVPPRVEYELTPKARTLLPHAIALADWAVQNIDAASPKDPGPEAPARTEARATPASSRR